MTMSWLDEVASRLGATRYVEQGLAVTQRRPGPHICHTLHLEDSRSDRASLRDGPFMVPCRHCGAASGEPCRMPSGQIVKKKRLSGWAVHDARYARYYLAFREI